MAESPERIAQVFASKAENEQKRKDQRAAAAMRRQKADQAAKGDIDGTNEAVMRLRWLHAYEAAGTGNRAQASRDAGYSENICKQVGYKNYKHWAKRIAQNALDKDSIVLRLDQQSRGIGNYAVFDRDEDGNKRFNWDKTHENLQDNNATHLIIVEISDKNGEKITFKNPDVATRILSDASGLTSPPKVDVTVLLASKTPEEKQAIRDGALKKAIALKGPTPENDYIDADFEDDNPYDGDD